MAFNPFHTFRKYSKTMFAVLAIVCMFTFVLSSGLGRGDFFTEAPSWLGGGGGKYPEVAQLGGKRIDARQVLEVQERRKWANIYMMSLVANVHSKIIERVDKRLSGLEPFQRERISEILQDKAFALRFSPAQAYGIMRRMRGQQVAPGQVVREHIMMLGFMIDGLNRDNKTDDAELLAKLRGALAYDLVRIETPGELYFGGKLNTGEDILDFMVWKSVADKHDIQLQPESVDRLVEAATLGEPLSEVSVPVEQGMSKNFPRMKPNMLREALADEFRVQIAQAYLSGQLPRRDTVPAYVTPYEFKKYYDDVRRAVRVTLLPVNVDSYVAQVKGTPTDPELKELFEKYKKDEWTPDSDKPGFKEPKRVKLEFVGGKPDSPFFRKSGLETAQREGLAGIVLAASLAPVPHGTLAPAAGTIFSVMFKSGEMPEAMLESEYRQYQSKERISNWVYTGLFFFTVHETSVVRPENYAATIADVLASRGTGGSMLNPWMTLGARGVVQDLRDRIRFGLQPLAAVGGPHTTLAVNDAIVPQPLPLKVVRSQLLERVEAKLAKNRFVADFAKLQEEFKKKNKDAKKPEVKQELQKLVAEFVKKYPLTHGASTELRDKYTLVDDPGLKVLKEQYFKDRPRDTDPKGEGFSFSYFTDFRGQPKADTTLFDPLWFENKSPDTSFSNADEPYYLTWITDDVDARIRTFEAAKPDVLAAWKRDKARELADEAAKKLQKEVRDAAIKDLAVLKDFAAKNKVELIELSPLAKVMPQPAVQPGMPPTYMAPNINRDKVEYPTRQMVDQILDLRDKPLGEAILVNDMPKSHYYVAVLLGRDEPTDSEFQQAYARLQPDSFTGGDPVLHELEFERRAKFRKDMMEQLRSDVKLTITNAEELKRFDSSGSGSDE